MLTDSFNRNHDYLRISLTDKCNLRCTYCMPVDPPHGFYAGKNLMNAEEINRLAGIFVKLGVKKIRLTGGEPLIRKDVAQIIHLLSQYPVKLMLTTNGVFLDQFIEVFKQAGINSVNVSLDSLESNAFKIISQRDHFDKVMSNILLLLREGFHVKVNMVVLKELNHLEIIDFIQWTKEYPLHVRFIEYMPFRDNNWNHLQVFTAEEILSLASRKFNFYKLNDRPNDTARNFQVHDYKGTFAIISTMSDPFCSTCNRLRLTADGKMKNCLFSTGEVDLLSALRNQEDVEQLIRQCVWDKKAERGGQMDAAMEDLKADALMNRSMISIGG